MHLSAIGRLALLKEFYGKIIIPPTVWKEVVEEGMGRIEGTDVKQARQDRWVEVVSPTDKPLIRLLKRDLDEGEGVGVGDAAFPRFHPFHGGNW